MAGWHHWLNGREFEWTPGVGDGQGGLACCNSWGRKELDTTERLNWTEVYVSRHRIICLSTHTHTHHFHVFKHTHTHIRVPDVQAGLRKGRGTRDQITNVHWIIEKARELQKNIYFCFIDYAKAFDCVYHNKLWIVLKKMGIPDHLTCLLRNCMCVKEQQLEPDTE